jgi:predicted XRE-type DNA-binding protein
MTIEDQLKNEILRRYKTVKGFSEYVGVPNSTINSVFKRGIKNAGIASMIKIFQALDLDIESVAEGSLRKIRAPEGCDDFPCADDSLSPEERKAVELMRTNSDARAQIMLVMEMHKNDTPKE